MSNIVSGIAQKKVVGSSARKAVLMLMASCASDDGSGIWTSKTNMALDLEMSKRTVQAAIADLIRMGVVYEAGQRPCKNGYTVEYGIDLLGLGRMPCTRAADAPVQRAHPTRAADAPPPVQQMHPNHPLTIHEPSLFGDDAPKPKRRRPETDLPEGWVPSDRNIQDAEAKGFTAQEINDEGDRFRDFHAARGSRFRDWDAAWRTWLGNARKFSARGGMAGKASPNGYGRGSSIASIVARRHAQGQN